MNLIAGVASFLVAIAPASVQVIEHPVALPVEAQEIETSNLPIIVPKLPIATTSVEYIKSRIAHYADLYNVSADVMEAVVKCESNFRTDATNHTSKEYSVGLSQINLYAHTNTTESQARDIEYSLDFLASNLQKGNGNMWVCWTKFFGTSPSRVD